MFIKNGRIKLFADDTTIYFIGEDLDNILEQFNNELNNLLNWCAFNKMDVNWSKTHFMFFTNKKILLPDKLLILNNTIPIERVTKFKLLGCIIDEKLKFNDHISSIILNINRKLHSIKRIFYLSTSVKIQFFKTFLLPYFDYCLSLLIYMSKTVIQKIANSYYICLFKLFGFNILNFDDNLYKFNNQLKKYKLFSFHHRVCTRILSFGYSIEIYSKGPRELKQKLSEQKTVPKINYDLRNGKTHNETRIINNHGTLTFEYFFGKLLRKFELNYPNDPNLFKTVKNFIFENNDALLSIFLKTFPKFDVNIYSKHFFGK